ncbi:MAG: DUF1566 domain-containing protein, partial [Desulfuromonadaceae bacterium]|nr:DUF1566 domain-containing protein [Desulfuromonadaceae bacterium]
CYDAGGSILCSAVSETQDGKIKAGLALSLPNFNDNGDTTLTDTTTGLMWSQTGNLIYTRSSYTTFPGTTDWQGALDYVKTINSEWFSGYQDWRLPNRNELLSLMNYGVAGGLNERLVGITPSPFIDVPAEPLYWSSTSASDPAKAYQMLNDGTMVAADKATAAYLIVVRTPKADPANGNFGYVAPRTNLLVTGQVGCFDATGTPHDCVDLSAVHTGEDGDIQSGMPFVAPRFITSDDSLTTLDQSSGLTWIHNGNSPACGAFTAGTAQNFTTALAYVNCLNTTFYAGKADWRLPNILELSSLANASQTSNATWLNNVFTGIQTTDYWTSDSTVALTPAINAYSINIDNFAINIDSKEAVHSVLPVRGGYIAVPGRAFSLSTNAINFGTVPGRSTSDQRVFTITNDAGVELHITDTAVSGDGTLFKHDPSGGTSPCNSDAFVLPVGGSCTMSVAFTAAVNGVQTATLTVTGTTSSETIELSATGGSNSYSVSVLPAAGGVVTCAPAVVTENADSICTITADSGKRLIALTDNAADKFSSVVGNSYTISSIATDHTISPAFATITFAITTEKSGKGKISAGNNSEFNATASITVTPGTGQHISSVSGCNGTLNNNIYTTGPITGDCTVSALFVADQLSFTATSTGNGTISCLPAPAAYGDTITCTMTPADGYKVSSLTDNSVSVIANVSSDQYTLNGITTAHTLIAGFALKQYTVTPAASAGGTVTPSTAQTLNHGSTTQFTASASTGYHLVDFTTGTTCSGSMSGQTFTTSAITADCAVQANFSRNSYTVTSAKTGNGTIVTEGAQQVLHGDTVSFLVTPANGSHLVSLAGCGLNQTYSGNSQTSEVNAATSAITAACSVNAIFALNNYTITASKTGSGTISPTGVQSVTFGNSIAFTLTPATGQSIKDVAGTCGGTLAGTTYTTAAAGADCTVTANFIPQTFAISTNNGVNRVAVTPASVAAAPYGSVQTFQLTADAGYTVAVATGCSGTLSAAVAGVYTYTTGSITQACDIVATPLANTYTVTLSPGANGSLAGATNSGTTGTVLNFTATPAIGYHLLSVSGCGATFAPETSVITTAPLSAYCTLAATFAPNQYTVTTSGADVTFNPTLRSGIAHGAVTTFTVTPAISHNITGVSGCGGSWDSANGIFTTAPLTGDCTVSAATTQKTFAVTSPGAIGGGAINCASPVGYNATSVCSIAPQVGYHLSSLTLDTVNVMAQVSNNSYSISNVTAPHAVTGSFAIDTFSVTATQTANGTITAGGTYNYGSSPVYNITPAANYHITSVTIDGAPAGTINSYTFTNINANHTITATFAIDTFTVGSSLTGNGSITCTPATVNYGGSSVCTIAPTAGNKLTALTDNAGSVFDSATMKNGGTYSISGISSNHDVVATFEAYQYMVTASATGNGGSLTPVSLVYGD